MLDAETEKEIEQVNAGVKFSWHKVKAGIFKVLTWLGTYAYAVYTWKIINVIDRVLGSNGHSVELASSPMIIFLVAGWVLTTVCVVLNLQKAISAQIEKMKIEVSAKAELNKEIKVDPAELVRELKK